MIEAAILDLDGLLIDSEPFWREAEIEVLGALGAPITPANCHQTIGLRVDEVVGYWHRRHRWDEAKHPPAEVESRLVERVIAAIRERGAPLRGMHGALGFLRSEGLPLALASSARMTIIEAALDALDVRGCFSAVCSAESEPYGKPHPAVFLTAAAQLGVPPQRCLALEDSLNGLIAAKAARMACLLVPDRSIRDDPRLALADAVLKSLEELDAAVWRRLNPTEPRERRGDYCGCREPRT